MHAITKTVETKIRIHRTLVKHAWMHERVSISEYLCDSWQVCYMGEELKSIGGKMIKNVKQKEYGNRKISAMSSAYTFENSEAVI